MGFWNYEPWLWLGDVGSFCCLDYHTSCSVCGRLPCGHQGSNSRSEIATILMYGCLSIQILVQSWYQTCNPRDQFLLLSTDADRFFWSVFPAGGVCQISFEPVNYPRVLSVHIVPRLPIVTFFTFTKSECRSVDLEALEGVVSSWWQRKLWNIKIFHRCIITKYERTTWETSDHRPW